jgi:tryptophan synthase alpha chain
LEVGIPFSDPLADGPAIQLSSRMALERGTTPEGVLNLISRARKTLQCPLLIMTYWNPVMKMGLEEFAARAKEAGVSGVIVPDLPPEEAEAWVTAAEEYELATVFLVAPTTPPRRLGIILSVCRGFVYYVSLTGVTGLRSEISQELLLSVRGLKAHTDLPVAVGFGISTPEQGRSLVHAADGVIVGSALIRLVLSQQTPKARVGAAAHFAQSFRDALTMGASCKGSEEVDAS